MKKHAVYTFLAFLALVIVVQFWFIYAQSINEGRREMEPNDKLVTDLDVEKDPETQIEIPEELIELKSVSDVYVRETSIAKMPDVWRSFIYSEAPISDPTFLFGCEEYLDTGNQLIADVFTDQAQNTWVAESAGGKLIGIGQLSPDQVNLAGQYFQQDEVIGCLEILKRDYSRYYVTTPFVELETEFGLTVLRLNGVAAPLPEDVYERLLDTIDAGLVGNDLVFVSNNGIEVFDLKTWSNETLLTVFWDGLWALSDVIYDKEYGRVLYAIQEWDDPDAEIVVYQFSPADDSYETYVENATLAWQIGTSAHARLEFPDDLQFIDAEKVQIVQRPEFFLQVANGDFPPDAGSVEVLEWQYR